MRYVGDKLGQIDGLKPFPGNSYTYDQEDCVAAAAAALIDIATVGRLRFTATDVRRASGVTARRGLYLTEAADATVRITSGQVILKPEYLPGDGQQRGKLRNRLVAGQALAIVYDAALTHGTSDATNQFRGRHAAVFAGYRWREVEKPHAELYGDDPGTSRAGWRWWDATLMYRAAEAASNGGIWILAARDTEGVTRIGRATGNIRAQAEVASADIGNVRIGRTYKVVSTVRGGPWSRPDGSTAHGWHQIRKKSGRIGFVKGESLQ